MRPSFSSSDELVDYLVNQKYIESEQVEKAFRNVDRAEFVPKEFIEDAYTDRPVPIGEEATISAPHMVALNTELLEPQKSDRILEIGSGSGYHLAILAELCDDVTGVEISEDLIEKSRKHFKSRENIRIFQGSGFEPVQGSFDKILYSCAIESFEKARKHVKHRGIIVAPILENSHQVLRKFQDARISDHSRVSFVRFREED